MKNMREMQQLTSAALQFVEDLNQYVKAHNYILLHEEPIIHLRKEEDLSMTITQSIYIAESDIEITVVGYVEQQEVPEMVVESTFDFLLHVSVTINEIHELLKNMRDDRTNHFFICVRGSQEEGFCEDEVSIVIRKKHHTRHDDTFKQWNALIELVKEGQSKHPAFLNLDTKVGPQSL